ncbi:MAG: PP2C family protein-serine/threonine phosphatase [Phycisphaerales bacterium]
MSIPGSTWQDQLAHISKLMRDLSELSDPQEVVKRYGQAMHSVIRRDRLVAVSRRHEDAPWYRITRSDLWEGDVNPWTSGSSLPRFDRGILGQLLYAGDAVIQSPIQIEPDDPAAEYFAGMQSLMTIPVWDDGKAINMVVFCRDEPHAYESTHLPEAVWTANLFGRSTKNLVLSQQLDAAYAQLDEELKIVADIQRSLLPSVLPDIDGLDLAAYYRTSQYAGGDYYDFFPLAGGKWGLLVADVCGHGTPAAVLMAITHSLAHTWPTQETCPGGLLSYVNRHLAERYIDRGTFVTAFFGVFDPATRQLTYSSAGHNPPRIKRCSDGSLFELDAARDIPLGILPDTSYGMSTITLERGDQMILYTDGITEARGTDGTLFGIDRLDHVLENCSINAQGLIDAMLGAVEVFTGDAPPDDDRTMVVARVT